MLRTIICIIALLIFFVITAPVLLVNKLFMMAGRGNYKLMMSFIQGFFKVLIFISGIRLSCIDMDKLPKDKAFVVIMNHQSIFDIILSYPLWKMPTGYMSKKEMKLPLLSDWMLAGGSIFVDRSDIKNGLKALLDAIAQIKNGISMVIFPEGTVNKTGKPEILQEFKKGSFTIAQKSEALIVPIVIANSNAVFEQQKPAIRGNVKVMIKCLDPIVFSELSPDDQKEINNYCKNLMQSQLDELYLQINK